MAVRVKTKAPSNWALKNRPLGNHCQSLQQLVGRCSQLLGMFLVCWSRFTIATALYNQFHRTPARSKVLLLPCSGWNLTRPLWTYEGSEAAGCSRAGFTSPPPTGDRRPPQVNERGYSADIKPLVPSSPMSPASPLARAAQKVGRESGWLGLYTVFFAESELQSKCRPPKDVVVGCGGA